MPNTHQTKVVNAPISEVWGKFRDFHDFSWAPNVITHVEKVGAVDGGKVGAKRILNHVFHETLVEIDHDRHRLKYSIDDGPSPVSRQEVANYFGTVALSPIDDGRRTHVEWASTWDAKVDDAVAFCHGIYVALLDELAASFE